MMRAARPIACLALILAAACGPKPRPMTIRDLQSSDVGLCYTHASIGNNHFKGQGTLMAYVASDGAIPAAWFNDGGKLDSPVFYRCMTALVVESKHEATKSDHIFGWQVMCDSDESHGCMTHPLDALPPPVDESLAQASLTFSDWADASDKGWGYYYVHNHSDALATFRAAAEANPNDARAQRGLALSLIATGGDIKKAREAADKGVALEKNAASLEALVRVCLKSGDDECAYSNYAEAVKAADVRDRRLDIASLTEPVKAAADRLAAADKAKTAEADKARAEAEAKLAKADPLGCYKMVGEEQAKCYVKRCFEAGAQAYAQELTKASGAAYAAGEMISAPGLNGATVVTIPIRAGKHKKGAQNMDASWTVVLGDNIDMQPYKQNIPAYNISKDHNACKR